MAARKATKHGVRTIIIAALIIVLVVVVIALLIHFEVIPNFFKPKPGETYEGELVVHSIDVGQGDSSLILFPDDKSMLIDGGTSGGARDGYKINTDLPKYISNQGVDELDYVMVTHPDTDHYSAMVAVLDAFVVKEIYIPFAVSKPKDTVEADDAVLEKQAELFGSDLSKAKVEEGVMYYRFIEAVFAEEGAEIHIIYDEFSITGEGWVFDFYALNREELSSISNKNGLSPIGILEYSEIRMVFTGDAIGEDEEFFIDRIKEKKKVSKYDCHFLKVAHHGSNTEGSNSADFLDFISVEYAFISAGTHKSYNHPHQAVLDRLSARDVATYVTKTHGNLVFVIKDGEISVRTEYGT